jgi:hypothetical protein
MSDLSPTPNDASPAPSGARRAAFRWWTTRVAVPIALVLIPVLAGSSYCNSNPPATPPAAGDTVITHGDQSPAIIIKQP